MEALRDGHVLGNGYRYLADTNFLGSYLYLPFFLNCMSMHEVEIGGVSQETLTRRFPRLNSYGCSAGGSPRRPLPEGSLDHIRIWALHLPPGPTWHSSNHLAKSCSALLAESMGAEPMDSANLMRRHSEIDPCSLFQLVCRPSGFTQNAMRYPPRSPDITIEPQAKITFQTWFLALLFS